MCVSDPRFPQLAESALVIDSARTRVPSKGEGDVTSEDNVERFRSVPRLPFESDLYNRVTLHVLEMYSPVLGQCSYT